MKAGTQIIFLPYATGDDINHPDCLAGFIADNRVLGQTVFVYFWDELGVSLRTDYPQAANIEHLVIRDSVDQSIVEALL